MGNSYRDKLRAIMAPDNSSCRAQQQTKAYLLSEDLAAKWSTVSGETIPESLLNKNRHIKHQLYYIINHNMTIYTHTVYITITVLM